jgi:hypothetical protein
MSESKCPYNKGINQTSIFGEKKTEKDNQSKCPFSGKIENNNGNNDKTKEENTKKEEDSSDDEKPTGGCPVMNKSKL